MVYTLNTTIITKFKELKKASKVFPVNDSELTLTTQDIIKRESIEQLFSIFTVLVEVFNNIESNADLLTPSAIALMKDKEFLNDHLPFFADCHDLFHECDDDASIFTLLKELQHEYDLLLIQYDFILNSLTPSQEASLKGLISLLDNLQPLNASDQDTLFLEQLRFVINFLQQIEDNPSNLNPIEGFELRPQLSILLTLAPMGIKSELEKINPQILLHYEVMNLRHEKQKTELIPNLPESKENPSFMVLTSFEIGLCGLSSLLVFAFFMQIYFFNLKKEITEEISEGYCSANYQL